jgi:hypothetical protein
MQQSDDATPAYRGYRLQALYSLSRILDQNSNKHLVFQPEMLEDLSIEDETGNLLEVIQVKSGYITVLSFKESFFKRINSLIKSQEIPHVIIASFGRIGPELLQAVNEDGPMREQAAKKIKDKYGRSISSYEDAKNILARLELISLDEQELTKEVYNHLSTTLTGIDPDIAFDLLNFWLYIYSEKKHVITKNDIIEKIVNIGKFLSARAAYYEEWFRSIKPIDNQKTNPDELNKLYSEFYQGISARYDHILADIDIPRPEKIQDIKTKFKESRVVIIHGASGQGKTTLAYRYLHDHFPSMWRFKVELIENRRHALDIAAAIIGHADAIDIPIAIYLDVSAKDPDWPDLIKQLAFHQNIRILVTIREEDYKRASIPDFEIQFKDVDLNFDKSEAQEIYHSLEKTKMPPQFLSFEEAWDKFGGEGPLMEFIHLVTQGESLRKRLKEQITRLENEARNKTMEPGEIDLLRLVSVASAFDAHLKVKPLIDHLKLAAASRTFELFEKEYLLERSADGSLVEGLHPIRSKILADLLIDRVMSPWSEYAITCLSLMHEVDIESFLLHSFFRHREDTESLIGALSSWQPDIWAAIGGITRALIWLGISEYVESNRELIQKTFEDSGTSFTCLLDSDISNAMPGISASSLDSLCSLGIINEGNRQRVISYRDNQTDKTHVFVRAKTWLSSRTVCPKIPQCNEDWSGIAESSFWLGQLGISWPFSERIPYLELEKAVDYLPMEILADLILGLSTGYGKDFTAWLTENRPRIINRFREETLTVNLHDDGNKVTAHFLIEFEKLNNPKFVDYDIQESSDPLHDEAMGRVKLLRGILPDRDAYACQGYGHKLWSEELPLDNTQKTGIPISQLPPKWLTSINSTFRGLAEQPFRPKTWEEYAKSVFELRKQNLSAMNYLENGLKAYFENQKPDQLFGKLINAEKWFQYQQMLSKSPLIPSCAIDEWGLIDEFGLLPTEEDVIIRGLALQKHKPFLAYFKKYTRYLSNFFNQSIDTMVLNSVRGRSSINDLGRQKFEQKAIDIGLKEGFVRLSRMNLSDCVKIIPTFQRKFRRTFGQFFELSNLDDLEKEEISTFHRIWCMWYFFSISPNLVQRKPEIKYARKIDKITESIKKNIQKGLSNISSHGLSISVISYELFWGDTPALWILVDGDNGVEVYNSIEKIFPEFCKSFDAFKDKEPVNLIFSTRWPLIIIIPTIQGKCLTNTAWRIYSNTLLWGSCDGKLGWWNYATQYPVPQDALTELNINLWDLPQLEVAASLNQNTFKLSLQLASIRDYDRLPELDDQGIIQFKTYLQKLVDDISIVTQNVLDSGAQMMNILGSLSVSDYNNHPNLVECRQALIEMNKYIMPVPNPMGKITLDQKTIKEWANELNGGKLYAALAYLFWANDIIYDYSNTSGKLD